MILLRLLSWPYLRKHALRWTLTVAGIVLGVAVFVAMHSANQSVFAAFDRTVDRIAGKTQLQVWAGDFGFPEEVLEKVQSVREVDVAVPVIEASGETGLKGQGNLLILGTDMTGDQSLRDYDLEDGDAAVIDDPLVFLAQPDSIMLSREFADRNGIKAGDRLPMKTMAGDKLFTVRGIMKAGGMAKAFGGNLAIMDIYAVQKVFGRGQRFDRIDVGVKEGVPIEQAQQAIRKAVGPGFEVEPPQARCEHFESMLRQYQVMVNVTSLFALIIGMFIIYNAFSIAVTQRRSEVGILRALGATRRQIRALFLGESAVAGLAGSLLGVAAGVLMARGIAKYIGALTASIYGVAQQVDDVDIEPWVLASAIVLGVATSMVAAFIPARNAARVDPVQALQKGKYQVLSEGENRVRTGAAMVTAAGAAALLAFGHSRIGFYAGYALALLTALLLAPTLALLVARALRQPLKWLRPVEGALAADSLLQAPRRTSATVSALMLSLAMVIGFGGMSRSFFVSVTDWMDSVLNPDFFLTGSESIAQRAFSFPGSMGAEVESVPGVDQAQMVRSARVLYKGTPVMVVAVEADKLGRKVKRKPLAGDPNEMYRLTAAGAGALVSDSFANLRSVRLGDPVELPTPRGILRLPVVGITRDYSDQQGTVLLDRGVYKRWWDDDTANIIRVYVKPGANKAEVRQAILDRFSKGRRLFILSNAEVKTEILRLTDQWFGMTYNQVAVAVLVAVLGIVNTLMVSITDRRRELGVLQAVGAMRNQIRHTVWLEALAIGVVGLVLGFALGAVNLHYTLGIVQDVGGMRTDYIFPMNVALTMIPVILGAAFIAALWPAETTVRGSLMEALEYE
ncbi:MAG TPA: FtsX-like permease family protein [Bryobacteraceae bacterium]|nr:FtsX-like permease family protein [Bryobacteraceae bacterium]